MAGEAVNINTYVEEFEERVRELLKIPLGELMDIEERNKQVEQMIEDYFKVVGKFPSGGVLNNLGTYLLNGDLKNRDVDKVTNTEYPILSQTQLKRRLRKQVPVEADALDYLDLLYNKPLDSLSKTPVRKGAY